MKMVSGLLATIAMLVVLAAPPVFARAQHHSESYTQPATDAEADFPEMTITDEWQPDLIVAPPVTRPSGSVYDTPKPRAASVGEAVVTPSAQSVVSTAPTDTESTPKTATSNIDHVSAAEIVHATVDGAKIDGAAISAPQDGIKTAALVAPSASEEKKGASSSLPVRTPGSILFDQTHDDSALDPASWAVNVFKRKQELLVYYKGRLFKRYEAVFGRSLDLSAKLWAQDRRTPEGVYTIIEKYPSARFHWFLKLNYPNLVDRVRYETLRVNGVVPTDGDGKEPTVGSAIGIHGTDVPILNSGHINWTTGCISVENSDIEDLERLLPVGTVVIIKQ
jgi:hypothetical protein